jgi:hypothetical protein
MSRILHTEFDGLLPSVSPRKLPEHAAQVAENVKIGGGRLESWKVPLLVQSLTNHARIFPWRRGGTTEWQTWATDVDVVQSPEGADTYERIYITDGVKPYMRGWDGGVMVQKYMERPTGSAPTATATDRTGFGSSDMATATAVWAGSMSGTYTKISGGVKSSQTMTAAAVNFIGTVITKTRDKNTGIWTVEFSFSTVPIWSYSGSVGDRITDIVCTLTGSWTITLNGVSYSLGDTFTINDGSTDFGTALISAVLPTPTYQVGANTVTGVPFTGNVQFIPTFIDTDGIRYVRYVQTLVDSWSMEGPPSSASNEVTWAPGQKVVLSSFGSAGSATKRRFYRTKAGSENDDFYFVAEVDAAATSYEDVLTDAQLGDDVMPTFENPPAGLKGIIMLPANFAVGFVGREVWFSEPNYPWSWPAKYAVTTDWDIIGLGASGNDVYVLTKGQPYMLSGYHPESMNMAKLNIPQSCVSKRSIAMLGGWVVYASPDGLVGLSGGTGKLLTEQHYSRDEWQALTPANMIGAVHDNAYFGFLASGGIVLQLSGGRLQLTTITTTAVEAYTDLLDDMLYVVISSGGGTYSLYKWHQGATNMQYRWRGRDVVYDHRAFFSSARVDAESYPVVLLLYCEGDQAGYFTASNDKSFRLPKLDPGRVYSLEIQGSTSVHTAGVASSMQELVTK